MHIQARVSPKRPGPGDETGDDTSTTYRAGGLEEILRVLEDGDFNIRSATGSKIELGGEFGFAVGRDGDEDHEQRTHAAVEALRGQGFTAHVVDVQTRLLDDTPGALRKFVADVSGDGLLIEEIAVGTPAGDGRIPVQIYTARAESEPDAG